MLKIQNYYKLIGILFCLLFANLVHAAQTGIVNFSFSKAGVYRISYQQLFDAGVDLQGVRHNRLALTHGDNQIYIKTKGQTTGKKQFFGPGALITFVVPEVESTQYTDDTIYTLHVDKKLRKAIPNRGAKLKNNIVSQEYYQATHLVEQQSSYFISTGSTDDPWVMGSLFAFGAVGNKSYTFSLDGFEPSQGDVTASFFLSGGTNLPEAPDHHAQLILNGNQLDDQEFDGFAGVKLSGTLNASQLTGVNDTLEVSLPYDLGLPFDYVILDKFNIQYPRKLTAISNALSFESDSKQFKVSGFDDDVSVFQIKQNGAVEQLSKKVVAFTDGSGKKGLEFAARNVTQNVDNQFFAVADNGYILPEVAALVTEEDISSGSAEYLVITHSDFYGEALDRLVQLRQSKYTVKVVNVEQIYTQFGKHVPDPTVIKDYIKYATENLSTKMVVLIGGDTYDYKNYISSSVSFIPTPYFPVESGGILIRFTPSDASYGDLDGNGVPEVPVGRFPVRTAAEMTLMVDKLEDYENRANLGVEAYDKKSVFVADHLDNGTGYSFTNDANALISLMPQAWQNNISDTEKAYLEQDGGALAKTELLSAVNDGTSLVSFVGHSNHLQWSLSNPVLFNTTDAMNLLNTDKPSVFTQWGCWNTYYVLPAGNGLAQALLLSGNKGAATVLGASTLTQADTERGLANFLYKELFIPGKPLGQAVIDAKQGYFEVNPEASDVFLGWQILGDPAIEMEPSL